MPLRTYPSEGVQAIGVFEWKPVLAQDAKCYEEIVFGLINLRGSLTLRHVHEGGCAVEEETCVVNGVQICIKGRKTFRQITQGNRIVHAGIGGRTLEMRSC